ncbi:hypothetical protein A2U01_0118709, partial [Trifolium medium]|nr:hypothetical protein [Trifolium medium]
KMSTLTPTEMRAYVLAAREKKAQAAAAAAAIVDP